MTGAGKQGERKKRELLLRIQNQRQNNNYKEHSSINVAEEKLVILIWAAVLSGSVVSDTLQSDGL